MDPLRDSRKASMSPFGLAVFRVIPDASRLDPVIPQTGANPGVMHCVALLPNTGAAGAVFVQAAGPRLATYQFSMSTR
jgi:hypothetical protein